MIRSDGMQKLIAAVAYKIPLGITYNKLEIPQEDGDPDKNIEKVNENEDIEVNRTNMVDKQYLQLKKRIIFEIV